jgi:hypothetical protein
MHMCPHTLVYAYVCPHMLVCVDYFMGAPQGRQREGAYTSSLRPHTLVA